MADPSTHGEIELMQTRELLETALPILEEWQRYTVNNIANVDTPGFQPQQVDFKASLHAALSARPGGVRLARTHLGHLATTGGLPGLTVRPSHQATHRTDGNAVDLDYEMTQLARNPFRTVSEILKNQNRLVRDVLRSR